ncbi:MAG: hypothetical protein WCC11_06215 [Gammaproteobacteria bacterium]
MKTGKYPVLTAILLGGLIGGTIDIGSAALINRFSPVVILHAIASGLIGKASFSGGAATAFLGLLLQWSMALLIAAIYMTATARIPGMRRRWRSTGIIAGVVIFIVMNYVVVPLSAAPFRPELNLHSLLTAFTPYKFVGNLLAMILFGLIIGFFAHYLTSARKAVSQTAN